MNAAGSNQSWKSALDTHFRSSLLGIHTNFPAVVVAVNGDGTVNIKPLINTVLSDGVVKDYDIIPSCRVGTLSVNSGKISIRMPLYVGDEVWAEISERDMSGVVAKGSSSTSENNIVDRFDLADCIVTPIFNTTLTQLPIEIDKIEIHNEDNKISIGNNVLDVYCKSSPINVTSGSGVITLKAPTVVIESDSIEFNSSSLTHNGVNIGDTHTHAKGTYKDAESRPLLSGDSDVPA